MSFWIRDMKTELGITVLMVEHDMTLVNRVSDRVIALNYGRVLAMGAPAEVQRHPDVVDGPQPSVLSRLHVRPGLVVTEQRPVARIAVVGRDVHVAIERQRGRDHFVVRLVTRARRRAMGDEAPQDDDDDGGEQAGVGAVSCGRRIDRG